METWNINLLVAGKVARPMRLYKVAILAFKLLREVIRYYTEGKINKESKVRDLRSIKTYCNLENKRKTHIFKNKK